MEFDKSKCGGYKRHSHELFSLDGVPYATIYERGRDAIKHNIEENRILLENQVGQAGKEESKMANVEELRDLNYQLCDFHARKIDEGGKLFSSNKYASSPQVQNSIVKSGVNHQIFNRDNWGLFRVVADSAHNIINRVVGFVQRYHRTNKKTEARKTAHEMTTNLNNMVFKRNFKDKLNP